VGHAYSALNLRLALAAFGLVTMTVFAVLAFRADLVVLGVACAVFAVVAVVDLVVIQRRRAARRREEPGARHSLFE
jgi:membrane protein implicated in regulation of membrane protease activity